MTVFHVFTSHVANKRRGHRLMFFEPTTMKNLHLSQFEIRVVNPRNALPAKIVMSTSLAIFRSKLDGTGAFFDTIYFPDSSTSSDVHYVFV